MDFRIRKLEELCFLIVVRVGYKSCMHLSRNSNKKKESPEFKIQMTPLGTNKKS